MRYRRDRGLGNGRYCRVLDFHSSNVKFSDYLAALVRFRCLGMITVAPLIVQIASPCGAAIAAWDYGRCCRARGADHPEWVRHFPAVGLRGTIVRLCSCFQCRRGRRSAAIRSLERRLPSSVRSQSFYRQLSALAFRRRQPPDLRTPPGRTGEHLGRVLLRFVLVALFAEGRLHENELVASGTRLHEALTELRLLYEHAPIGLAFLTAGIRYREINRRLTEICGLRIADHIGSRCEIPSRRSRNRSSRCSRPLRGPGSRSRA